MRCAMRKLLYMTMGLVMGMLHCVVVGQNVGARDYFLMGSAKYKCNACREAVEDFTKAIELKKDYAEAYYGRSLSYLCEGDTRSALRDIESALKNNPKEVLYIECKARIKAATGDNKGAAKDFEDAIGKDSLCWQAWYGLAVAAEALKDTVKARVAYTQTIRLSPNFTMAYIGRGTLRLENGQSELALEDLDVARRLEPGYAPIFVRSSRAYLALGDLKSAEEDASVAARLSPEVAEGHYLLGEAKLRAGNYQGADLDFLTAGKLDKTLTDAFYKRGICHDSVGDFAGARKYYSAAIKKDKNHKEAYVARAKVWVKEGKGKKAVVDLGSALKLDKDDLDLYLRRGFLYIDVLDYQGAIQDFTQVLKKSPSHPLAYYGLGLAKYGEGNVKGACGDWSTALELGEQKALEQMQKYCVE